MSVSIPLISLILTHDGDLLVLLEEADARGWSSSMSERSLALRRHRGSASRSSSRLGCGCVASSAAATAEQHGCRHEEAAVVGAGAAAEEKVMADDPTFEPPPMAMPRFRSAPSSPASGRPGATPALTSLLATRTCLP